MRALITATCPAFTLDRRTRSPFALLHNLALVAGRWWLAACSCSTVGLRPSEGKNTVSSGSTDQSSMCCVARCAPGAAGAVAGSSRQTSTVMGACGAKQSQLHNGP